MITPNGGAIRVLVSGAASGVGLACAEAFAARGAELVIADNDGTSLTQVAERLGAHSRFCDSVSESSVAIFAEELARALPSLDVLINAAGQGYVRSLAMVRMTRALLPLLRRASGRRFVFNVAPAGGFSGADAVFPYASSRPAFEALSHALSDQTKGNQIEVVNIAPRMVQATAPKPPARQVYLLERIDEEYTADRIVAAVAEARPDWRQRPIAFNRRA